MQTTDLVANETEKQLWFCNGAILMTRGEKITVTLHLQVTLS